MIFLHFIWLITIAHSVHGIALVQHYNRKKKIYKFKESLKCEHRSITNNSLCVYMDFGTPFFYFYKKKKREKERSTKKSTKQFMTLLLEINYILLFVGKL